MTSLLTQIKVSTKNLNYIITSLSTGVFAKGLKESAALFSCSEEEHSCNVILDE
jgi:hypothetical protein